MIETQVFPKRLCDTEVRVGGIAAGLLYVQARQINFKAPQELPVEGTTEVRVTYKGQSGPVVRMNLARTRNTESAQRLAETIWSGLQRVKWETAYRQPARGSTSACSGVPAHPDLRGGLYGHAYYCSQRMAEVSAESLYYPAGGSRPAVLLRRADFRLAIAYPEMSKEVEQLLTQRLVRAYGPGTVPENLYEIGASRPNPGLSWRAGEITIFLHRNRNFVAPAGVREGVQLIAVRNEVLRERELKREIDKAFGSTSRLAYAMIASDLKKDLGTWYLTPGSRPAPEADRAKGERETRAVLLALLGQPAWDFRDTPLLVRKAILDVAVGLPPGVTPGDHLRASQWSRAQNIKLVLPPVPVGQALCSLPLPSPAQPRPAGGRRMLLAFPSWKGVLVLGFRGSQGRSPRRVQESLLPPIHPRIPPTDPPSR
jgi:hypothetical protein